MNKESLLISFRFCCKFQPIFQSASSYLLTLNGTAIFAFIIPASLVLPKNFYLNFDE